MILGFGGAISEGAGNNMNGPLRGGLLVTVGQYIVFSDSDWFPLNVVHLIDTLLTHDSLTYRVLNNHVSNFVIVCSRGPFSGGHYLECVCVHV